MGFFDFLKPAWQSNKLPTALKAVENEKDQTKLVEIAKNAPLNFVRKAAILKLTDQKFLAELAESSLANSFLLEAVVERLTDQEALADIARQAGCDDYLRIAVLTKLNDDELACNVFTEIIKKAKKSGDIRIRLEAARRLTAQSLLAELAQRDPDFTVREAAVAKLTDQEALTQIAKFSEYTALREAAAKKLTDKGLAQDILGKIEKNRRVSLAAVNTPGGGAVCSDSGCANEPLTYAEFVNSVKMFMNIREFDKVQTAIKHLTNRKILSDIINSTDAGWDYDRGQDNYGPYHIVDLRDTARMRLEKLEKDNIPERKPAQGKASGDESGATGADTVQRALEPNRKPNNDMFFIVNSLKNAQAVPIGGLIDGLVIMTPPFAKTVQKLPTNAERLYQFGLSTLMGIETLNLVRNPSHPVNTKYYGTVVIHYGFPQVCLKCGKPVEKFELLMAPVFNEEGIQGRVSLTAENAQEIFDVLKNVRHFLAVPCCAEHSLADRFFFWMGTAPFFTDDQDIAATCRKHLNLPQTLEQPVKVVNGKIVK